MIPGVDMEIKDTEVEQAIKETDPTTTPITSDTITNKTAYNDLPTFKATGNNNPKELVVTPSAPVKVKKTTPVKPALPKRNKEIVPSATSSSDILPALHERKEV